MSSVYALGVLAIVNQLEQSTVYKARETRTLQVQAVSKFRVILQLACQPNDHIAPNTPPTSESWTIVAYWTDSVWVWSIGVMGGQLYWGPLETTLVQVPKKNWDVSLRHLQVLSYVISQCHAHFSDLAVFASTLYHMNGRPTSVSRSLLAYRPIRFGFEEQGWRQLRGGWPYFMPL